MFCADVDNRSLRPTPGCFLSPGHWKDGIMLRKGKAAKVPSAVAWAIPPHKGGCPRPTGHSGLQCNETGAGCPQPRGERLRKEPVTRAAVGPLGGP